MTGFTLADFLAWQQVERVRIENGWTAQELSEKVVEFHASKPRSNAQLNRGRVR